MNQDEARSRVTIALAAILWVSALAALFIGMRLRLKPVILVGGIDALLALFVTMLALRGGSSKS